MYAGAGGQLTVQAVNSKPLLARCYEILQYGCSRQVRDPRDLAFTVSTPAITEKFETGPPRIIAVLVLQIKLYMPMSKCLIILETP